MPQTPLGWYEGWEKDVNNQQTPTPMDESTQPSSYMQGPNEHETLTPSSLGHVLADGVVQTIGMFVIIYSHFYGFVLMFLECLSYTQMIQMRRGHCMSGELGRQMIFVQSQRGRRLFLSLILIGSPRAHVDLNFTGLWGSMLEVAGCYYTGKKLEVDTKAS
jgi:hypothetical protein